MKQTTLEIGELLDQMRFDMRESDGYSIKPLRYSPLHNLLRIRQNLPQLLDYINTLQAEIIRLKMDRKDKN